MCVKSFLMEPQLRGIDLSGDQRLPLHQRILSEKKMIRDVFKEFYETCVRLETKHFGSTPGAMVEIGAGTSFFKSLFPKILSTDIEFHAGLDLVVDAQDMPFESKSVRSLFCINAFHHFPEPERFFSEALRVLHPGGGFIIIDPAYGLIANFLFRRLFSMEGYDRTAISWGYLPRVEDKALPNQALSYLVFFRDLSRFRQEFPQFDLVEKWVLPSYLRYLLSGGLNFRQLVPDWMVPAVRAAETMLTPLNRQLALHHLVVVKKKLN